MSHQPDGPGYFGIPIVLHVRGRSREEARRAFEDMFNPDDFDTALMNRAGIHYDTCAYDWDAEPGDVPPNQIPTCTASH